MECFHCYCGFSSCSRKMAKIWCFFCISVTTMLLDVNADNFLCRDGSTYLENNCNICTCTDNVLQCTAKVCSEYHDPKWMKCQIGKSWTDECNECHCHETIGTVCTNLEC